MKKLLFSLCVSFLLSISTGVLAWDKNAVLIVFSNAYGPITAPQRPSRVPQKPSSSLEVYYDEVLEVLSFYNKKNDIEVTYSLYNEQEELEAQGECIFDDEGIYIFPLSGLLSGRYTLYVYLNGVQYQGTFEVEE